MSLCLCLDSSTDTLKLELLNCSDYRSLVKIWLKQDADIYHSTAIFPELLKSLHAVGAQPSDLSEVVINTGPGSFTGLRTSCLIAKTMAQQFNIRLYRMTQFELLAAQESMRGTVVEILIAAFRNQHYRACLSVDRAAQALWTEPMAVRDNILAQKNDNALWVDILLKPKLQQVLDSASWVDLQQQNTTQAMAFLMKTNREQFGTTWQSLTLDYLQLPSISSPKKTLEGAA
jgi:tRNA threonylcarbamoyl adenosine modification protein YeaZ